MSQAEKYMSGKYGCFIIYIFVFSFTLSGCYTTDYYSDTPENIMSGKSEVILNDVYWNRCRRLCTYNDDKNFIFPETGRPYK